MKASFFWIELSRYQQILYFCSPKIYKKIVMKKNFKLFAIVLGVVVSVFFTSCQKESLGAGSIGGNNAPTVNPYGINVTTKTAYDIHSTYFVAGGTVTCGDQSAIRQAGLCYSTNATPQYESDFNQYAGTAVGSFEVEVYNLRPNTKYYFRAFAIDKDDRVVYGSIMSVITTGTPTGQY